MSRKKPKIKFVNFHGHSNASIFDGFGYPEEHLEFAYENGLDALALTDHGNMNNLPYQVFHAEKMLSEGRHIKPIFGVEAYVHPSIETWLEAYDGDIMDDSDISAVVVEDEDRENFDEDEKERILKRRRHMVLLAKNQTGLNNIFKLISLSYQRPHYYKYPRMDYNMLREYSEGVIGTSACLGGTLAGDYWENRDEGPDAVLAAMRKTVEIMMDIYGDDWYGELQWNRIPEQHELNQYVIKMHKEYGFKLISAADAHYPRPEMWQDREMYKRLGWLGKMDEDRLPQSVEELGYELYPKNGDQMWEEYKKSSEQLGFDYDDDLVRQSIEITQDIAFSKIENFMPERDIKLPNFVVPKDKTPDEALEEIAWEGFARKSVSGSEYEERLKKELFVIKERGFSKYFLTMIAINKKAREKMLIGPGRGSAAGSLLSYVLDITQVDPIRWDTQFERFLRKDAVDYPDIDVDYSFNKELKEYLAEEWGEDTVVPISNISKLQIKSTVKDVSKFYGVDFDEVNKVTTIMMNEATPKAKEKHGITSGAYDPTWDETVEFSPTLQKYLNKYPRVAKQIEKMLGQPRAVSRHAAGVVISDNLDRNMPLINSGGTTQTPWSEGMAIRHLEPMGFIKFDILGLGTLRMFEAAITSILQRYKGVENPTHADVQKFYDEVLHPDVIDFNNQEIWENIFHEGKWGAIFQFTKSDVQNFCQTIKPMNLLENAAITSIWRPGPLGAGVDKQFKEAKEDPSKREYINDIYKEVTESTYGFCVFQEQIAELAHKLGKDISLDEGNLLRKLLTKKGLTGKKKKKKEEIHKKFVEGCLEKELSEKAANDLWEKFEYFLGYGFNKSHAIAYSMITFQCAYLLHYYPECWMAAYLNEEESDGIEKAISIARQHGFKIEPPSINYSSDRWEISEDGKTLFQPLTDIKGFGDVAYREIKDQRPFKKIEDLIFNDNIRRAKVNKTSVDALCRARALDELVDDRFTGTKHFWTAVAVMRPKTKKKFYEYIEDEDMRSEGSFSKEESVAHFSALTKIYPFSMVVSDELLAMLEKDNVKPLSEYDPGDPEGQFYWLVPLDMKERITRTKKTYWQIEVIDSTFKKHYMKIWNVNTEKDVIAINRPYIVEKVVYDPKWGFSTGWKDPFHKNFALIG